MHFSTAALPCSDRVTRDYLFSYFISYWCIDLVLDWSSSRSLFFLPPSIDYAASLHNHWICNSTGMLIIFDVSTVIRDKSILWMSVQSLPRQTKIPVGCTNASLQRESLTVITQPGTNGCPRGSEERIQAVITLPTFCAAFIVFMPAIPSYFSRGQVYLDLSLSRASKSLTSCNKHI